MKLAVIADGHLFQSFMRNYDPLNDFKIALEKIKNENAPDALLMAGDMFDVKKTPGTYLRHYEGEGLTISIREILKKFGLPIFAIRGNHEREEVLKGLTQTVENFHYKNNEWEILDHVTIYFMGSHFEGDFYEPEAVAGIIQQLSAPTKTLKRSKLLLCHETFAPLPNCLPAIVIKDAKKTFDWILNGHMHFWSERAYRLEKVVTLPALLPSKVVLGKYWVEQFRWRHTTDEPELEKRDSPYGYTVLDTEKGLIEFCPFHPSKKIVEVSIEATGLTLGEAIKRFRSVLEKIRTMEDKDTFIILPEVYGEASFVTTFIKDIFKDYTDLNLEDLRINTTPKITTASGKVVTPPLLTPEQVFTELEKELPNISDKLKSELQMDIEPAKLKTILNNIRKNELLEKIPPRTTTRLENLLDVIILELKDFEKPETYEDNLKNIVKRVKE
jgi:predicted phosphodiesterase